jgi:hypothetical protein
MQPPNYLDLVKKLEQLKEQKPSFDNRITPILLRERSPNLGDRRPLAVQRRRQRDSAALFPGGDDREEALARRSKTVPKEAPTQRTGSKRKATGPADPENEQRTRRPPPKPEGRLTSRNRIRPEPKPKPDPKSKPDRSRTKKK